MKTLTGFKIYPVPIEVQVELNTGPTIEAVRSSGVYAEAGFFFMDNEGNVKEVDEVEFKERLGPQIIFEIMDNPPFFPSSD